MSNHERITQEELDDAIRSLAHEDGVELLLAIPGVWELVAEDLNNAAIREIEIHREA